MPTPVTNWKEFVGTVLFSYKKSFCIEKAVSLNCQNTNFTRLCIVHMK